MAEPRKIVTLTYQDLKTDLAKQLLDLSLKITEDGEVSIDEIKELQKFLGVHHTELRSAEFMRETLENYFNPEHPAFNKPRLIHTAIERILPIAERKQAKLNRQLFTKQFNFNNKTVGYFSFIIAGCYKNKDRAENVESLRENDKITLEREIGNPYDKNAILVYKSGYELGYIPKEFTKECAELLDQNYPYKAFVKKIYITHKEKILPAVVVRFYNTPAKFFYNKDNAIEYTQERAKPHNTSNYKDPDSSSGCFNIIALIILGFFVYVAWHA